MGIKTTVTKKSNTKSTKVVSKKIKTTVAKTAKVNKTGKVKKTISTKKEPSVYKRKTELALRDDSSVKIIPSRRSISNAMKKQAISVNPINKETKKFVFRIFKYLFQFIVLIFLVMSVSYGYDKLTNYLYSKESSFIDSIEIEGCDNVMESEISNLIDFKVGESLWKVRLSKSEKELLSKKPELKSVDMKRKWKEKKVVVSLQERVPEVFLIDTENNKLGLDFDNKPFRLRGEMSSMKIPTIICSNAQEQESLLKFYKNVKPKIQTIISNITEIKYGKVYDDVILVMNDKVNVCWGVPKQNRIGYKSEAFLSILSKLSNIKKEAESIDLSYLDNNKGRAIVKIAQPVVEEKKG